LIAAEVRHAPSLPSTFIGSSGIAEPNRPRELAFL
jgi:hypothetical protein